MEPQKSEIKQNTAAGNVKKKTWVTPEIGVYGIAKVTQSGDTNYLNHDSEFSYS